MKRKTPPPEPSPHDDTAPEPALPDTGAGASAALLAAPDVQKYIVQRQARINRVVADLAAERPIAEDDMRFVVEAAGDTLDSRIAHARQIAAADAAVAEAAQALADHLAEGERLRVAWQEAEVVAAGIGKWSWHADGEYKAISWAKDRASDELRKAAVASQGNGAREVQLRARLLDVQRARAALDEASPKGGV